MDNIMYMNQCGTMSNPLIGIYPHLYGKGTIHSALTFWVHTFLEKVAGLLIGHLPEQTSFATLHSQRIELILRLRIGSQNHLRIGHCRTRAVGDAAGDRTCVHTEAFFLVRAQCHQLSAGTGSAILIGCQTILIVLSRSGRVVVIHIRRIGALHRVDRLVVFVGGRAQQAALHHILCGVRAYLIHSPGQFHGVGIRTLRHREIFHLGLARDVPRHEVTGELLAQHLIEIGLTGGSHVVVLPAVRSFDVGQRLRGTVFLDPGLPVVRGAIQIEHHIALPFGIGVFHNDFGRLALHTHPNVVGAREVDVEFPRRDVLHRSGNGAPIVVDETDTVDVVRLGVDRFGVRGSRNRYFLDKRPASASPLPVDAPLTVGVATVGVGSPIERNVVGRYPLVGGGTQVGDVGTAGNVDASYALNKISCPSAGMIIGGTISHPQGFGSSIVGIFNQHFVARRIFVQIANIVMIGIVIPPRGLKEEIPIVTTGINCDTVGFEGNLARSGTI